MKRFSMWALSALLLASCATGEKPTASGLLKSNFQTEVDGKKTDLFVLRNANNMEVCITNFGGRIVSVMVPDREGVMRDVVLGFDSIRDYITIPSDFGASIGRYANRINQGTSYLVIITVTVCMEGRTVFNIRYMMPGRLVRRNSSSPIFLRMEKKVFPAISLAKC